MRYIPVVDNTDDMNLLYQVKVQELMDYCDLFYPDIVEGAKNEQELNTLHNFEAVSEDFNPRALR